MPSGIEETAANISFMELAMGWHSADPLNSSSNATLVVETKSYFFFFKELCKTDICSQVKFRRKSAESEVAPTMLLSSQISLMHLMLFIKPYFFPSCK